jgi:hypothetical protein
MTSGQHADQDPSRPRRTAGDDVFFVGHAVLLLIASIIKN